MSGLGQSCRFQPSETFPLCRRERTSLVPMVPLKLKSQNHLKRAREPFRPAPDPCCNRIVEPTRYETILNLRTAKAIGPPTAMPRKARRSFG
jgi:hypothetical protein